MPEAAMPTSTSSVGLQSRPSSASSELSVPVEFAEDGQAVVARVLFNAPIKREYLSRLKAFLDAWQKTLPQ